MAVWIIEINSHKFRKAAPGNPKRTACGFASF
jgi:hypothetical protein